MLRAIPGGRILPITAEADGGDRNAGATGRSFDEYYGALMQALARRDTLDEAIGELAADPRWSGVVGRLVCLRGMGVLSAVESDAQVTQRKLSSELGIALGLANLYLKRCVRKGWIKIGQVPMRRYAYYLTPQGFTEKARLTGEYLSWNLEFFRRARRQSTELFVEA